MPSSKSVLRDIHDLKLDPSVAHSGVKASGRLKKHDDVFVSIEPKLLKAVEKIVGPVVKVVVLKPETTNETDKQIVVEETSDIRGEDATEGVLNPNDGATTVDETSVQDQSSSDVRSGKKKNKKDAKPAE